MRQDKVIGVILAVMSVALAAVCAVLYIGMDRTAPEFGFQASDVTYTEGIDQQKLLGGISAYDNRDGDVTDRIVIEKIIEDRENNVAVVYYAVSDKVGNAAKASRVFDTVYIEEKQESGRFPEAGIDAEMNFSGEIRQMEADGALDENETDPEDGQGGSAALAQTPESTPEPEQPTPMPTPIPQPTPEPTPAPTPRPAPTADPAIPVLTLKVSEVKVKAGQGPAWVDIIGILSDDKDSYETLFHNLSVSKYDRDKAGSYAVSVHTEDSDGNRSQSVPLTIVVE